MEQHGYLPQIEWHRVSTPAEAPLLIASRILILAHRWTEDPYRDLRFLPTVDIITARSQDDDLDLYGFVANNNKNGSLTLLTDDQQQFIEVSTRNGGLQWGIHTDYYNPDSQLVETVTFARKGKGKKYFHSLSQAHATAREHHIDMDWRIATTVMQAMHLMEKELLLYEL